MRQYRYRAWHKKGKFMFKVYHLSWWYGIFLIGDKDSFQGPRYGSGEVELMQYTGMFDAQKQEICEGDILYREEWTTNHAGNRERSYQTYITVSFPDFWCDTRPWDNSIKSEVFEIIGNIYEHPNLLEKVR